MCSAEVNRNAAFLFVRIVCVHMNAAFMHVFAAEVHRNAACMSMRIGFLFMNAAFMRVFAAEVHMRTAFLSMRIILMHMVAAYMHVHAAHKIMHAACMSVGSVDGPGRRCSCTWVPPSCAGKVRALGMTTMRCGTLRTVRHLPVLQDCFQAFRS